MTYNDVYFRRISHLGITKQEHFKNSGIREFEMKLNASSNRVELETVEGMHFSAIALLNKEDEAKKTLRLDVAVDIPVHVGTMLRWHTNEGLEYWLLYQKQRKVNESFQTFYMVQCNSTIRWIDADGHIHETWGYILGHKHRIVVENFRNWKNDALIPNPNKFITALLPEQPIDRGTRLIIGDEGWLLVEYDNISVSGVRYISLTEERVNALTDSVENNLADIDKLANYVITSPAGKQSFAVGEEINPLFNLTKNGVLCNEEIVMTSDNSMVADWVNGKFMAKSVGDFNIIISLKEYPQLSNTIPCSIGNASVISAFIDGPEQIKLNRYENFTFVSSDGLAEDVVFGFPEDTNLVKIVKQVGNVCTIKANDKNKVGSTILSARYRNKVYNKTINIVPIW